MENTTVKTTKVQYIGMIKEIFDTYGVPEDVKTDIVANYLDKELASLERRKERSAERAAQKRAESDALTDEIYSILTDEPQTVEDILAQLQTIDVTRNKVISRLGKLVKNEQINKAEGKFEGSRKMVYTRAE